MMVVDSSAIVAIRLEESDFERFVDTSSTSRKSCMSAVNKHETAIALRRNNGASAIDLTWRFLAQYAFAIIPFDGTQAKAAAAACEHYGKGINSKSKLNLADCAAYALNRSLAAPPLFKGRDFTATDVRPAL